MDYYMLNLGLFLKLLLKGWLKENVITMTVMPNSWGDMAHARDKYPIRHIERLTQSDRHMSAQQSNLRAGRNGNAYWESDSRIWTFKSGTLEIWSKLPKRGIRKSLPSLNYQAPPELMSWLQEKGYDSMYAAMYPVFAEMGFTYQPYDIWVHNAMASQTIEEFWMKLCGYVPTRDIQREVFRQMNEFSMPSSLFFLRLSKLVEIPGLRELIQTHPQLDAFRNIETMEFIKLMATLLRRVSPNRRSRVLESPTNWYELKDTERFIKEYRDNGIPAPDARRARSWTELHDILGGPVMRERRRQAAEAAAAREARLAAQAAEREALMADPAYQAQLAAEEAARQARMNERERLRAKQNETEVPKVEIPSEIPGSDIEVVQAEVGLDILMWGNEQNHCIGSYVVSALQKDVILLGFRRDGAWVAHCSIERELVTQLLAKHNMPVSKEDYNTIMGHLKAHGLVKKDTEAQWGNPYADTLNRF